jgi:Tfp pilus assembly protein PilW
MMRRCEGTTLIDVLVGLAVGLVSVVVAYQAFVALDTLRRNDAAVADAQASGAFALLAMEMQAGNAGAGTAAVGRWLDTCAAGATRRRRFARSTSSSPTAAHPSARTA